jgi:hypothetical protein
MTLMNINTASKKPVKQKNGSTARIASAREMGKKKLGCKLGISA